MYLRWPRLQLTRDQHPRILFAEDDAEIGYFVTEMLRDEGFDVTTVENGDEGALVFDNHQFHLLLTDVRMPGTKDGLDLAAYARQKDPGLSVVIVSGYADDLGVRLANLGQQVAFLRKPFLIRELVSAIEGVLFPAVISVILLCARIINYWQKFDL